MTRWLWLALILMIAACEEQAVPVPARNECLAELDCHERAAYCDKKLFACVRPSTSEPYELIVRVVATTQGTMLADAGVQLAPVAINNLDILKGGRAAQVLTVPRAVTLRASIKSDASAQADLLSAQLTLSARDAMVPIPPTVVETRYSTALGDGGVAQLSALLNPELDYEAHVQPLLASSGFLPPIERTDIALSEPLEIAFPNVEEKSGKFVFRDDATRRYQVRLQDKQSGRVVSSTVPVQSKLSSEGRRESTFTLHAEPEVFAGANFDLVVSPAELDPWQVTVAIDGARFLAGGDMFLPKVPTPIHTLLSVEETETRRPLAHVDLVFVSRYPLPTPSLDVDASTATDSVGGTDWCRWDEAARITCSGRFQTASDEDGKVETDLLPGEYEAYILPRASEPSSKGLIVTKHETKDKRPLIIQQAGGGLILMAKRGSPYAGTLLASGVASPGVTVRALRRPTPPFSLWGSVANFNRNVSAVTDGQGHFELWPDVGYYDFVLETADDSNFPWKLWLDCPNGPGAGGSLRRLDLSTPVVVSGVVEYEGDRSRLPKARIEAFAVVEGKNGERRSVLIGRTTSDSSGAYSLVLPPQVGERDRTTCEGSAPP